MEKEIAYYVLELINLFKLKSFLFLINWQNEWTKQGYIMVDFLFPCKMYINVLYLYVIIVVKPERKYNENQRGRKTDRYYQSQYSFL